MLNSSPTTTIHKHAFTLIELSIVLVIIGLIVGGVLVGKDLIQTAKRRQALTDVQNFNVATMTFKNKYNCLPGDCTSAQAAQFGLSAHPVAPATNNGDNNGKICERGSGTAIPIVLNVPQRYECRNYWWHLSQTELINWTTSDTTANCSVTVLKFGESTPPIPFRKPPGVGVNTASSCVGWLIVGPTEMNIGGNAFINKNHAFLMMGGFSNHAAVVSGVPISASDLNAGLTTMTPEDAFYIDTKLDDGYPTSGTVRAIGLYQDVSQPNTNRDLTEPFRGNAGTAVCINNSVTPNIYNTSSSVVTCNLSIEAAF